MTNPKAATCIVTSDDLEFYPRGPSKILSGLPPGLYSVKQSMTGYFFATEKMQAAKIVHEPQHATVLGAVERFWSHSGVYTKHGLLHRRGVLFYGPPGTGKSTLVRLLVEDTIHRGGVVVALSRRSDIGDFKNGLSLLRDVAPEQPVMLSLEDLDSWMERNEEEVLDLLDGLGSSDHILTAATTNKFAELSARLTRPSRFDLHVEVGYPSEEARRLFIGNYLTDQRMVTKLVKATKDKSIADIKELVLQQLVYAPAAKVMTA